MHIPTYVLFIVAPINVLLNYLLVWGPAPLRLGFIGGAVATAISFNLTGMMLLAYVMLLGPREAFHPLTARGVFSKLGTVTSLGLAGTIMVSGFVTLLMAASIRMVGMGDLRTRGLSSRSYQPSRAVCAFVDLLNVVPASCSSRHRHLGSRRQPSRCWPCVGSKMGKPRKLHPCVHVCPFQQVSSYMDPLTVASFALRSAKTGATCSTLTPRSCTSSLA